MRTIAIKLNAGFLLPMCESLPNYMRKEVAKHARAMGIDSSGSAGGSGIGSGSDGAGAASGAADLAAGLDPRTSRLRASIDERLQEREMLQRIAARMRARGVGVPE